MGFQDIMTSLQKIPGVGLYSQQIIKYISPFMSDVLFGIDVNEPKATINFKELLIQSTTSEDGKSVRWRLVAAPEKVDELASDATAGSTTITVNNGTIFSVGDSIKVGTERKFIVAIAGNTLTLDSKLDNNHSAGEKVIIVSHAKGKGLQSDRSIGNWQFEEEYNYYQVFDSVLQTDWETINSHILGAYVGGGDMSEVLKNKEVQARLQDYLRLEFIRTIGYDILRDIETQFWEGIRSEQTIGGTVRRYTGGFEQYKTAEITGNAASKTDKELFDEIWKLVYDTENEAAKIRARDIVIVCNNTFYQRFLTLEPNNIQYPSEPDKAGYQLSKLFINGKTYEVAYSPVLDELNPDPTKGVAYIFPKDSVAGKTLEYIGIQKSSNSLKPVKNKKDILVTIDPTAQAAGDVIRMNFMFPLAFIFGGYTPSKKVDVYKKVIYDNMA